MNSKEQKNKGKVEIGTTRDEHIRIAKQKYGDEAVNDGLEMGWQPIELERGYIHSAIQINELICLKDFDSENKVGNMEVVILDNMDDYASWAGLDTSLDSLLDRAKSYNEELLPELYMELVRFMDDEYVEVDENPTFMPIKNAHNIEVLERLKTIQI